MDDAEIRRILEGIIRDGSNAAARIAAIRELRAMDSGVTAAEGAFAELDEVAERRLIRRKTG